MKVKSVNEVTQSCPTLSDPMDCSLPGSSAHGIFQARVLEWGAIAFSAKGTNITLRLYAKVITHMSILRGMWEVVLLSSFTTGKEYSFYVKSLKVTGLLSWQSQGLNQI